MKTMTLRMAGIGPVLRWVADRWDVWLLIAVAGLIIGMAGSLLVPPPEAEVTLTPLSEPITLANTVSVPAPDSIPVEKPRRPRRKAPRQPVKPPVLNLNTATAAQLELLPGIGPAIARRIVEHRRTIGRFATPEAVMDVKGIGPKKFEAMKPYLRI